MRNAFAFVILLIALIASCGKQNDFKLEKDTPAYRLAQEAAKTIPYLDPEKNNVLISSKKFNVTTGETINHMSQNFGNRAGQLTKMSEDQMKANINQFANILGERKILLREAEKANIVTEPSRVDSVLSTQYQRSGGEERFMQFLEKNGQSIEHIRSDISTRLIIESYLDQTVYDRLNVSPEDIEQAYREDKTATVRHILMNTQGKSDSAKQEIRRSLEAILERAKKGEDFAELAKEYSEDPGSKHSGGLYPDIQRGQMVKPFEEAAFSVPIGEFSDVFETQYGYHVLTVVERKKETLPLESVRQQLEHRLKQQKTRDAYQQHLDDLKNQYGYEVIEF